MLVMAHSPSTTAEPAPTLADVRTVSGHALSLACDELGFDLSPFIARALARAEQIDRDAGTARLAGRERARAALGLSPTVREGQPAVILVSHAEWPGGDSTEHFQVDAAWWDSLTEDEQERECQDIAVEHLANHAGSGASVTGRTDGTPADDPETDEQ